MFGSFSALSATLSGALDRHTRVLEKAGPLEGGKEIDGQGKKETGREEQEEDQVEDSRQPGLTSECSGSDWTGFAWIP